MNSKQYEELCRYLFAQKPGIGIDKIKSIHIPNPSLWIAAV